MGFFNGINFDEEAENEKKKSKKNSGSESYKAGPEIHEDEYDEDELNEAIGKELAESLASENYGYFDGEEKYSYQDEDFDEDSEWDDEDEDEDDDEEDEDDLDDDDEEDSDEEEEDEDEDDDEDSEEVSPINVPPVINQKGIMPEMPAIKKEEPPVIEKPVIKETKTDNVKGGAIVSDTVIGKDCTISGNVSCGGFMTVNGTIQGGVNAKGGIVVGKGAAIGGAIESEGNVNINGAQVGGPVSSSKGSITINGKVTGNVEGVSITLENSKVIGDVTSQDALSVGKGAVVIGDVSAPALDVKGAIKGNVDVKGDVFLHKGAVVKGNITSASIGMEPGVVVDGTCRQAYANVNMDELFSED